MPVQLDLTNQQFGRLTARIRLLKNGRSYWKCDCSCGNTCEVSTTNLRSPTRGTRSCGCLRLEACIRRLTTHGLSKTHEWGLLKSAKYRAKRDGLPFNLTFEDIRIPNHCPLLDIPLDKNGGKRKPNSPSIDRIDSTKGYTNDNTWVISFKANVIKNNATPEELMRLATALRDRLNRTETALTYLGDHPSDLR